MSELYISLNNDSEIILSLYFVRSRNHISIDDVETYHQYSKIRRDFYINEFGLIFIGCEWSSNGGVLHTYKIIDQKRFNYIKIKLGV